MSNDPGGEGPDSLRSVFDRGAEGASEALSRWLGRPVRLLISAVDRSDLSLAGDLIGPADDLVAACSMGLSGRLDGMLLLVFEDRSGLAIADFLLARPIGSTSEWGELERSAAMETANIVGCAYLNALADAIPDGEKDGLVPTPPEFRHEFAGSLLEFALMDQAAEQDEILLVRTEFVAGPELPSLRWTLLFVPGPSTATTLGALRAGSP